MLFLPHVIAGIAADWLQSGSMKNRRLTYGLIALLILLGAGRLPPAVLFNGPVVDITSALEPAIH